MNRVLKIVLGIVLVLVVIVVGGLAYVSTMDFNQYKGLIATKVEEATGRKLTIAGDLNLKVFTLNPALVVDGVTFANASWGSRPEMVKLKRLEAQVSLLPLLTGTVHVDRLVLDGLDVLAETNKKGQGNWEFKTAAAKPAAPSAPSTSSGGGMTLPEVNSVRLKDILVTYHDGQTNQKMVARIDSLDVEGNGSGPMKVSLKGSYNDVPYLVQGQVGSIQTLMANSSYPVKLQVEALGAKIGVDGSIAKPMAAKGLDLALNLDVPALAETVKKAAAIAPAVKDAGPVPAVAVNFKGKLKDANGGYAVNDMALKLGKSDLEGSLAVALAGSRPKATVDLKSNLIDVDQLLPKGEEGKAKPAPAAASAKKSDKVFPSDPLPVDGLKAADANVKFAAKKVIVQGNTIDDVSLTMTLVNGKLVVKPLLATYEGGKINTDLTLDASKATPTLALNTKVDQFNQGAYLKKAGITNDVEGKMNADVDVSGAGKSVAAIMAGLNGKVLLTTKDGKIDSSLLNVVSTDIIKTATMQKSAGDRTLDCGVIRFDITKGQAVGKTLLLATGGTAIVGDGKIDLANEKLALHFDPRARKTNMLGALIPFNVGGTLASPSVLPDASALATTAAKTAAGIATGGLTTVIGIAADQAGITQGGPDETNYCALAFADKPLVRAKSSSSTSTAPAKTDTQQAPAKESSGPTKALEDIGKGLGGIFGGSK